MNNPEQNIIYGGNFSITTYYPNWQYIDIESPVQISAINSFYISSFILYISALSDYSRTILYNDEFQYSIDRDEWSEGTDTYFAIKVFIRKPLTSIDGENEGANNFHLEQNYPNPFNPITNIKYRLSSAGTVTMKVVDVMGRIVAALINNKIETAGEHKIQFNAAKNNLSSGVYFCKLFIKGGESFSIKMIYMK